MSKMIWWGLRFKRFNNVDDFRPIHIYESKLPPLDYIY